MLGMPVQWQVLKALKVGRKESDLYSLRKFKRGKDVEDSLIALLQKQPQFILETQKELEYRNTVGLLDILVSGDVFDFDKSHPVPVEVKSVTNAAFKWINKTKEPYSHHKLQAGFYAVAMGLPKFSILYVASDDLRITHFIMDTKSVKKEIDEIITEFDGYIKRKEIPLFVATEKWQSNPEYNSYPKWTDMNDEELAVEAKRLFL